MQIFKEGTQSTGLFGAGQMLEYLLATPHIQDIQSSQDRAPTGCCCLALSPQPVAAAKQKMARCIQHTTALAFLNTENAPCSPLGQTQQHSHSDNHTCSFLPRQHENTASKQSPQKTPTPCRKHHQLLITNMALTNTLLLNFCQSFQPSRLNTAAHKHAAAHSQISDGNKEKTEKGLQSTS
jgi:hypothetical protein